MLRPMNQSGNAKQKKAGVFAGYVSRPVLQEHRIING